MRTVMGQARCLLFACVVVSVSALPAAAFDEPAPASGPAGDLLPDPGPQPPGPQMPPPDRGPRRRGRDMHRPPGPGRGGPQMRELTDEQIAEALRVLRKYYPEMAQRLQRARERAGEEGRPGRGRRFLRMLWPKIVHLIEADREDPDHARDLVADHKLQMQIDALTRRYHRAKGEQREQLKDQLRQKLAEQFEVRQRIRRWRVEKMQRELDRLKDELAKREANRGFMIDRELKRRLEAPGHLEW